MTTPLHEVAARYYSDGKTIREVAAIIGTSYGATRRILLDAGVTLREAGLRVARRVPPTRAAIAERRRSLGWTQAELGRRAGSAKRTVADIELGITRSETVAVRNIVKALEAGERERGNR